MTTTTPWYERLSGLDAAFLYLEDRTAHMHVGAVGVFQGPAPAYRDLLALAASRLDRAPRLRQRLEFVPFDLGRPVWVDDARFQLEYHLRHAALPSPGDDEALARFASAVLAQRLDRGRPPWETWLVEGLDGDRFALLWKMHHCMVDGIAGVDLASAVLDADPEAASATPTAAAARRSSGEPASDEPAPTWSPRRAPGAARLLAASLRELGRHPVALARRAMARSPDGTQARLVLLARARPFAALSALRAAPLSSLNAATGLGRRFETVSLDLAAVKRAAARVEGTVNDVVLATVAGALRAVLATRAEPPPAEVQVMVPVNVRRPDPRGAAAPGNQVAAMFCPLPVGEPDALTRLRRTSAAMKQLKGRQQALGTLTLLQLSDFVPPPVTALFARQSVLRWFNAVVTNIPGPQFPLYLAGRKMLAWYPVVPLAPGQTLGVAILSYDGSLGIGILADAAVAGDAAVLARALPRALEELCAAAAGSATAAIGA